MSIQKYKLTAAGTLIALSACFMSAGLAYGRDGSDDTATTSQVDTQHQTEVEHEVETESRKSQITAKIEAKKESKTKLNDAKKRVCQLRSDHIQTKMTNIVAHGTKQLAVFDKIADRTKAFALAHNRKPTNYDALVADVAAKRQAAVDGLAALKANQATFTCDGDAHGIADSFKVALKSEIGLLKSYKTSVRTLIVGVKSAKSTSTDATDDTETSTKTTETN